MLVAAVLIGMGLAGLCMTWLLSRNVQRPSELDPEYESMIDRFDSDMARVRPIMRGSSVVMIVAGLVTLAAKAVS